MAGQAAQLSSPASASPGNGNATGGDQDVSGVTGSGEATALGDSSGGSTAGGGPPAAPAAEGPAAPAGSTVGVTKDSITISVMVGFTGQFGPIFTKLYENGFMVWVDDVNANGGIHGRKIIAKKADNKDTSEGGVAACKDIIANGSFLAVNILGFAGADTSAADCLDRAGIVDIGFNLSSYSPEWKNVYSAGDPSRQARPLPSFIKNVIKSTEPVGIIYVNDPQYRAMRDPVVEELANERMKLVRQEAIVTNQSSFVAELSRLRDAGAKTVVLLVGSTDVHGILRDARALRYEPNWTGTYWAVDETSAPALMQGIQVLRNYATTNAPAFAPYVAKAKKYGRGDVTTSTSMALYGIGLFVGQVLENAGPNPTREGIAGAIESIVNYNNQINMTLSFGKGVRVAEVGMWPAVCCNPDGTWRGTGEPKQRF